MRVREIKVEGLFDIFDHIIPLNLDDHITIIHGPNGFGKTILLQMIHGLFNNSLYPIEQIPFEKFEINFDNGCRVCLEKQNEQKSTNQIQFNYYQSGAKQTSSFNYHEYIDKLPEIVESALPELHKVDKLDPLDRWVDRETNQLLNANEVLENFGDELPLDTLSLPEWWHKARKSIDIHLVETQRLSAVSRSTHSPRERRVNEILKPIVLLYAQELSGIIQEKFVRSAYISQALDHTYPKRLAEQLEEKTSTDEQLQQQLQDLENHWVLLDEVGLLDDFEETTQLPDINSKTRNLLTIYIQDMRQKLSVFDDLVQKIKLFTDIINQRFLYKQIEISRELGFSFTSTTGKSLPVTALSSGEQHELVLFYELIFKTPPNSLILIDEPELSLHVAWEQHFLRDLQRIIALSPFDVLMTTHSPQIIHDRWDLTVELKGKPPL